MSLQDTDREAAAVAVAPRVALADIEAKIMARYDFTGDKATESGGAQSLMAEELSRLSICLLVMRNGFMVLGKSAPASSANFNADLGRKFAYEDAIRQVWPLEGYLLRSTLTDLASKVG